MLGPRVPWTVSMSEERLLSSHVRLPSFSPSPNQILSVRCLLPKSQESVKSSKKTQKTQKCCRLSNQSKGWEHHLSALESGANSRSELREYIKKQRLNFATSPPSLGPVTTFTAPGLSHEQGRPRRGEWGGCVCVCVGGEHEGETVITNSSPGSPRSVD